MSLYDYCSGDPVNRFDADGRFGKDINGNPYSGNRDYIDALINPALTGQELIKTKGFEDMTLEDLRYVRLTEQEAARILIVAGKTVPESLAVVKAKLAMLEIYNSTQSQYVNAYLASQLVLTEVYINIAPGAAASAAGSLTRTGARSAAAAIARSETTAADAASAQISTELSLIRYTQPGEKFIRYESANAQYTKITSTGGVQPGTYAAPASDGIIPVADRVQVYNLPSPSIPRPEIKIITPPPNTPIIGPRSVDGGTGNEVIFPTGSP
jgi:hypothetical protein